MKNVEKSAIIVLLNNFNNARISYLICRGIIPFLALHFLNLIKTQIPLSEKLYGLFCVLIVERQSEFVFLGSINFGDALFFVFWRRSILKLSGLSNYKNLYDLILTKLCLYGKNSSSFSTLFDLMFSEEENIIAESLNGYKIIEVRYGESKENALKLAQSLEVLLENCPKNSMIGLNMANSLRWIEMFWAILLAGYKPLLINFRLPQNILENIITQYSVQAVISDSLFFSSCDTYMEQEIVPATTVRTVNSFTFGTEVVFMSSGTQGDIKLCGYTAERFYYQICDTYYIVKDCPQIRKGFEGKIKQLALLPFYHIFGFTAVYLWFGFFSRTFVFLKDFSPQTLLNTVRRHKVTHVFAVPLVWETIYKKTIGVIRSKGEATERKFNRGLALAKKCKLGELVTRKAFAEVREQIFGDSIRFLISGGSGIDQKTVEFFNAIGYHFANGYGMTELGITSVELSSKAKDRNSLSVGKPFRHTQYKIEEGRLFVKSNTRATRVLFGGKEYATNDDEWFDTGDLVGEQGERYFIEGRADDLLVGRSGENLNPNLIESLLKVDGAEDICLFKLDDAPILLLSCPKLYSKDNFVKIKKDAESKIRENRLENEIKKIVLTSSPLIEGSEFKISRKKVAQRYKQNLYNIFSIDSFAENNNSELQNRLKKIFAKVLQINVSEIGADDNFFLDLGGNSLDYFSLADAIKEEIQIILPLDEAQTLSTIRLISDYIQRR